MSEAPEPTFVSNVAVSGFVNGVINVAFVTYQFLPEVTKDQETGEWRTVVGESSRITANLRFDLLCAQELHARLGRIIEENTKPAPRASN